MALDLLREAAASIQAAMPRMTLGNPQQGLIRTINPHRRAGKFKMGAHVHENGRGRHRSLRNIKRTFAQPLWTKQVSDDVRYAYFTR